MNAPTPRTDQAEREDNGETRPILDLSRQLECELAATQAELAKWQAEAARLSAEREHNANMAGMWQALAEGLAVAIKNASTVLGTTPRQDLALAAYEAAKAGLPQKASLDAGPGLA